MNEELREPLHAAQVDAYLERIGLPGRDAPTVIYLDALIRAQLRTVPFENADVWVTGEPPSLATEALFDKIVTRRRGGYCFELNLLFLRLLQGLGFEAYPVIIHLGRPGSGSEVGVPAHCGIIVTVDGLQHFADVGYGGPVPDGSVPLNGQVVNGHVQQTNGVYTVVASIAEDGSRVPRFTFKNQPCDPTEFVPLNFYVSKREGSLFASDLRMNLRADDGFMEIGARHFRYRCGETTVEHDIKTPEEARSLAHEYFHVPDLPIRPF